MEQPRWYFIKETAPIGEKGTIYPCQQQPSISPSKISKKKRGWNVYLDIWASARPPKHHWLTPVSLLAHTQNPMKLAVLSMFWLLHILPSLSHHTPNRVAGPIGYQGLIISASQSCQEGCWIVYDCRFQLKY